MRILMIAPTPFFADRGGHVRIYEEMRILKKLGHKITLLTYHIGKDIPGFDIRRIPNIPWYRKMEAGPSYQKLYLDFLLFCKAVLLLWKERFDIIHAHLHEGAFIAGFARLFSFKPIPLVFDYQGSLVKEMEDHGYLRSGFAKGLFTGIEDVANGFADRIIPSSTNAAVQIKKKFQWKVYPLIDAVDTTIFKRKKAEKWKKRLHISTGKSIVVYLGVLSDYQGVDLLLNTVPLVVQQFPRVHFLLMGYPDVEQYQEKAKKLGIEQFVTFTGRMDYRKAPEYLSLGDIAVSFKKSQTEANGKVLNYMACGLPCVVSDTKVNRELLGALGIYTKLDSRDIANKMVALLKDREKQEMLAKKVRERAVKEFSYGANGKKLIKIYQALRGERKP